MSGADAIYDQKIKELAARPSPPPPERVDAAGRADNPLCGDRAKVTVRIDGGKITSLSHDIRGCLLCRASGSIAATSVPGLSLTDARNLVAGLKNYLTGTTSAPPGGWDAFAPLRNHATRHNCALLPLQALSEALGKSGF